MASEIIKAPPRAQFRRVKYFRKPPGSMLCARPGPLGNPFRVGEGECPFEAVEQFERWARTVLKAKVPLNETERKFREAFEQAKQATKLLCYCRLDQPCHVDVMRRLIEEGF